MHSAGTSHLQYRCIIPIFDDNSVSAIEQVSFVVKFPVVISCREWIPFRLQTLCKERNERCQVLF